MADKLLFQAGDDLSEQNLTEVLALQNQTGYIVRGLGLTHDDNDDTLDIGSGYAVLESNNNEAYHAFVDTRSNLSLASNDVNHVFLDITPGNDDDISIEINTSSNPPTVPALSLGDVDTNKSSPDSVTEDSRNPDVDGDFVTANTVNTEEADITNETLIKAHLDSDQSINSGSLTQLNLDSTDKDERGEVDTTNNKIVVDKTGWYYIMASISFDNPSDGDFLSAFLTDDTDSSTLLSSDTNTGGTNRETLHLVGVIQLTAGNDIIIQVRNNSSSDTINSSDARTAITLRRAMR